MSVSEWTAIIVIAVVLLLLAIATVAVRVTKRNRPEIYDKDWPGQ